MSARPGTGTGSSAGDTFPRLLALMDERTVVNTLPCLTAASHAMGPARSAGERTGRYQATSIDLG
jgi:hypothetical protein